MAMARQHGLKAPFLRSVELIAERAVAGEFPFTLPFLGGGDFRLNFTEPITFFVGENGTGKSTLLEAIATQCGFNPEGGGRDHALSSAREPDRLSSALRLGWRPKVGNGFFFRAESFFNLARYLDHTGSRRYGDRDLHQLSHGEAFLGFFQHRVEEDGNGIYILDEPEAALSPTRQLAFLSLLHRWHDVGRIQIIIATHSPILLAYPHATILSLNDGRLEQVAYRNTDPYRVYEAFLAHPDRYLRFLLEKDGEESDDATP
jgi:predicted ATPase